MNSRAVPGLILANVNYVKEVVFPLEILPWVSSWSAMFHALISLGVWLIACLILFGVPHATVLLLPLVVLAFLPFLLFVMGLTWWKEAPEQSAIECLPVTARLHSAL